MVKKFTKKQVDTAVEVLANSRMVRNWVKKEAGFLEVDLESPEGKKFVEEQCRIRARHLLR